VFGIREEKRDAVWEQEEVATSIGNKTKKKGGGNWVRKIQGKTSQPYKATLPVCSKLAGGVKATTIKK